MSDLEAKEAITACLLSYTRGIDRLDGDLVAAAFHPGAICKDYGADDMAIEDFVTYAVPSLRAKYSATQHRISNIAIAVNGDTAQSEAYVLAFHVEQTDGQPLLHTFNGRYIDRFEQRDGHWRIAQRTLRVDWTKTETIEATMGGAWTESARDRTDVVYDT